MSYPHDDSGRILAVLIVYLQATILRQSLGGGSGPASGAADCACCSKSPNPSPPALIPCDNNNNNAVDPGNNDYHEPPHLTYSEEDDDNDNEDTTAIISLAAANVAAALDEDGHRDLVNAHESILEILKSLHISQAELVTLLSSERIGDNDDQQESLRARLLERLRSSENLWRFLRQARPDSGAGRPVPLPEQCCDNPQNDHGDDDDDDEVPNLAFTPMKPGKRTPLDPNGSSTPQSLRREQVVAGNGTAAASLLSLPGFDDDDDDDGATYIYDSPTQRQRQRQQQHCEPHSDVHNTKVSPVGNSGSTGTSGIGSLRALVSSPGDWDVDVVFGSPARAPPPDATGSGGGDGDDGRSGAAPAPSRRFDLWQYENNNTMMVDRISDGDDRDNDACSDNDILNNRRLRLLEFQTDVEADDQRRNRELDDSRRMAQQILDMTGQLLHHVDRGLNELDESLLGSALVRGSHELADTIGGLAEELERHPERRALAEACLQDFNNNSSSALRLTPSDDSNEGWEPLWNAPPNQQHQRLVGPSHDDVMAAVTAAAELLRDVEASLRAVERDEADEIAAVALTVAHLFVSSLVHVHAQLLTSENVQRGRRLHAPLGDHNDGTSTQRNFSIERLDDEDGGTAQDTVRHRPSSTAKATDRVRCLWPPIGPAVGKVLNWSKVELEKRHWILTAALGITLWPWAVAATCLGTPALLTDHAIQHVYNQFQQGPVISAAEVGAAQLYQTGRLLLLTGRALARPTLRVAHRQVQRHGHGLRDWAVHRVTHPVETVGETVSGLAWLSGQMVGTVHRTVREWQERHDEQRMVRGMTL